MRDQKENLLHFKGDGVIPDPTCGICQPNPFAGPLGSISAKKIVIFVETALKID